MAKSRFGLTTGLETHKDPWQDDCRSSEIHLLVENGLDFWHGRIIYEGDTAGPSASPTCSYGPAFLLLVVSVPYAKPYLSLNRQIALIESRGMAVPDHAKATEYLARIGYYRLSAFWYQFRDTIPGTSQIGDQFKPGTTFKTAVDLYAFDKALRSQVIDVLERIEIAMRTQIALQLGQYDPHAHRNPKLLYSKFTAKNALGISSHDKWLARLDEKAANSKEEFAVHFRTKYAGDHMPIWIAVELLDFGPLSHFLSGMQHRDAQAIAAHCGIPRAILLTTWIRALSGIRNVCAHHARLWNRPLVDQPKLPQPGEIPLLDHLLSAPYTNRRLYAGLAIARYFLRTVNPRTQWQTRLRAHLQTFPNNPMLSITGSGFPANWDQLPLWQ